MDTDQLNKLIAAYIVAGQVEAEARQALETSRANHQTAQERYSRAMEDSHKTGNQLLLFLVPREGYPFG